MWSGTLAYIYCIRSNQILGNTTILGIGCVYITEAPDAVMAASFVVISCNPIYFDAHKADPYDYPFISENTILLRANHKFVLALICFFKHNYINALPEDAEGLCRLR